MKNREQLTLATSRRHEMGIIESWIRPRISPDSDFQILEAGCGRKWELDLGTTAYFLTGVDMDQVALRSRVETYHDLDKAVTGDLRTVELESASFDVIYNSFVLEHVPQAERVLVNFVKWLKPGGLAVIRIPDPFSAYGFMARITPYWFHVCFYRYVLGSTTAGKPGYGPYPTYYDKVVSRDGMRKFCEANKLALMAEYGCDVVLGFRRGMGIRRAAVLLLRRLISILSLKRLSATHNNLLFIILKQ